MHNVRSCFLVTILTAAAMTNLAAAQTAKGLVFHDRNNNATPDPGEEGIAGVAVSNGRDVVRTDAQGRWCLPVCDDTILFVVKPSGWSVPIGPNRLPRFYYIHKPNGSPKLDKPGVAPTGPLPSSIDFPLRPQQEPEKFRVVFFADPQTRGLREVDYVLHDVVEELIGTDAAFGVTLGDLVADDANLFDVLAAGIAQIGIPWYSVPGNHDTNRDAASDRTSDESFERVFGPGTYALEYAKVVFLGYDDVFVNPKGRSENRFTDDQLAFTKAYLAAVPDDRLVVLMMHVPIVACANKDAMFRLIQSRPHTFSISGHAHVQRNLLLGEPEGWHGAQPHHHLVNATVSGSWWCGFRDELGIPHATMNDGAPNGYSIATFDGNRYSIRFKAARHPADYQMNIYLPDDVSHDQAAPIDVLVNIFAGSERSKVQMRLDDRPWMPLERTTTTDPQCARMHSQSANLDRKSEEAFGWKMDPPGRTPHMWKGQLPGKLPQGAHTLTVQTMDMFGQTSTAHRILRVP